MKRERVDNRIVTGKLSIDVNVDQRGDSNSSDSEQWLKANSSSYFTQKFANPHSQCDPAIGENISSQPSDVNSMESIEILNHSFGGLKAGVHSQLPLYVNPPQRKVDISLTSETALYEWVKQLKQQQKQRQQDEISVESSEERIFAAAAAGDNGFSTAAAAGRSNGFGNPDQKNDAHNLYYLSQTSSIKSSRDQLFSCLNGFDTQRGTYPIEGGLESARFRFPSEVKNCNQLQELNDFVRHTSAPQKVRTVNDYLNSEPMQTLTLACSPTTATYTAVQNGVKEMTLRMVTLNPNEGALEDFIELVDSEEDFLNPTAAPRSKIISPEDPQGSSFQTTTLRVRDTVYTHQSFGEQDIEGSSGNIRLQECLFSKLQLRDLCDSHDSVNSVCGEFEELSCLKHEKPNIKLPTDKLAPIQAGQTEVTILTTQGDAMPNTLLENLKNIDCSNSEDDIYSSLHRQILEELEVSNFRKFIGNTSPSSACSLLSHDQQTAVQQKQEQQQKVEWKQSHIFEGKSQRQDEIKVEKGYDQLSFNQKCSDIYPASQKIRIQQDNEAIREKLKIIVFSHTPKKEQLASQLNLSVIDFNSRSQSNPRLHQSHFLPQSKTTQKLSQSKISLDPPSTPSLEHSSHSYSYSVGRPLAVSDFFRNEPINDKQRPSVELFSLQVAASVAARNGSNSQKRELKSISEELRHLSSSTCKESQSKVMTPSKNVKQKVTGMMWGEVSSSESTSRRTSLNNSSQSFSNRLKLKSTVRTKSSQDSLSQFKGNIMSNVSVNQNDSVVSTNQPASGFIRLSKLIGEQLDKQQLTQKELSSAKVSPVATWRPIQEKRKSLSTLRTLENAAQSWTRPCSPLVMKFPFSNNTSMSNASLIAGNRSISRNSSPLSQLLLSDIKISCVSRENLLSQGRKQATLARNKPPRELAKGVWY